MTVLYTETEYESATRQQKLPHRCDQCDTIFYSTKESIRSHRGRRPRFCSVSCIDYHRYKGHTLEVTCDQCGTLFQKKLGQIKKSNHNFCSSSCSAKYSNARKKTGTRRSKLESWLEYQLIRLHPGWVFQFNRTDAITAELDIYIPSLRLAFELNGIYHYEPIHGTNKLDNVHRNDQRKILACAESGIELCILDTSKMKYFKEHGAQEFLDIIESVIAQATIGT